MTQNITDHEFLPFTPAQERRMRTVLAPLIPLVPTEPGQYMDRSGDPWTLNEDGTWTDHEGETKGTEWNWMLAWNLPYTPLAVWQNL